MSSENPYDYQMEKDQIGRYGRLRIVSEAFYQYEDFLKYDNIGIVKNASQIGHISFQIKISRLKKEPADFHVNVTYSQSKNTSRSDFEIYKTNSLNEKEYPYIYVSNKIHSDNNIFNRDNDKKELNLHIITSHQGRRDIPRGLRIPQKVAHFVKRRVGLDDLQEMFQRQHRLVKGVLIDQIYDTLSLGYITESMNILRHDTNDGRLNKILANLEYHIASVSIISYNLSKLKCSGYQQHENVFAN